MPHSASANAQPIAQQPVQQPVQRSRLQQFVWRCSQNLLTCVLFAGLVVLVGLLWGRFNALPSSVQWLCMGFVLAAGLYLGHRIAVLRVLGRVRHLVRHGQIAPPVLSSLEDIFRVFKAQSHQYSTENRAVVSAFDETQSRLQAIEACISGVTFIGETDSRRPGPLHLLSVGSNLSRFFKANRTEFIQDWQVILPQVVPADREALQKY
ncbi:MAG: hypothetical protein HC848_10285 [Limnobacter sp.]|nr:hypothetical protein [Limnobacter sp.]